MLKVGDVIAEKYRVNHSLGVGGMGAVYAVTHELLGEKFAVKVILAEHASKQEVVARFVNEARAAARIKNEHVAGVVDVGVMANGSPYMVMEYLDGADLENVSNERGQLPAADAVDYTLQALEALAQAHALGIVHRDLKPSNLFLAKRQDGSQTVKVLDFGISKVTGDGVASVTMTSAVLGSPYYMSPEQVRSSKDVDARSDVWSVGVILYLLLTKAPPFPGDNVGAVFSAILESRPAPPSSLNPQIPPGIDEVIYRCLARDRDKRYLNVAQLAMALAPFAPPHAQSSVERILRTMQMTPAQAMRPSSVPPQAPTPVPSAPPEQRDSAPHGGGRGSTQLAMAASGPNTPYRESDHGPPPRSGPNKMIFIGAGLGVLALIGVAGIVASTKLGHRNASAGGASAGLSAVTTPSAESPLPTPAPSNTLAIAPLEAPSEPAPGASTHASASASASTHATGAASHPTAKTALVAAKASASASAAKSAKPPAADEPPGGLFNRK